MPLPFAPPIQNPFTASTGPTGKNGRFMIRGVPDEPLTISAHIDAGYRTLGFPIFSANADAEPGQMDVRIVVDPKLVRRKK